MHDAISLVENTKNVKKISEKNTSKLSVKYVVLIDQGKVHGYQYQFASARRRGRVDFSTHL